MKNNDKIVFERDSHASIPQTPAKKYVILCGKTYKIISNYHNEDIISFNDIVPDKKGNQYGIIGSNAILLHEKPIYNKSDPAEKRHQVFKSRFSPKHMISVRTNHGFDSDILLDYHIQNLSVLYEEK